MPTANLPLFTTTYDHIDDFRPVRDSVYVYCGARAVEARGEHTAAWRDLANRTAFVDVVDERRYSVRVVGDSIGDREVPLRSADQIRRFWGQVGRETNYLDITALRHHVWAPLLRGAVAMKRRLIVIYVEPGDYRPSLRPTENEIYDLSERIEGVAPIPGFARLVDRGENYCFVPLLGFEGARVSHLIAQLEPPGGKVVPVVGVPGFRADYPFATYLGNRIPLTQTQAWKNVRYAIANCPFDLFYVLQDIQAAYPGDILKVAPIGTKPHALGSVLYAIANPSGVELVYDHPIRKASRTAGTARLLAYHVSSLLG